MSKLYGDNDVTICGHGYGNPSTKNLRIYSEQRYSQIANNGVHKGIVAVKRHVNMSPDLQQKFHDSYKTLLGRNIYDQDRRSYVYRKAKDGNYYSDCSSSGMATMRDKCGLNIGAWLLNTASIYESPHFETVPVDIVNGHIQNPEVLEVGDCILFAGSDPDRPKQIGHVEYVYELPGKVYPIKKETALYEKKDILSNRLEKAAALDNVRVIDDCDDGWSVVIFNHQVGYMKNSAIKCVNLSRYPESKIEQDCWLRAKNSSASKKIRRLCTGDKVRVVCKRKYWSRVKFAYYNGTEGGIIRAWVKTKFLT